MINLSGFTSLCLTRGKYLGFPMAFSICVPSGRASFLGEIFIFKNISFSLFSSSFSVYDHGNWSTPFKVSIKKLDDELFLGDPGVEQYLYKVGQC